MIKAVVLDCFGVLYKYPTSQGQPTVKGLAINQQLLDYAQTLRPNVKVGLLSNMPSESLSTFFSPQVIANYFDATVVSGDVGHLKPSKRIYDEICSRLVVDPSQAVLVDDSSENCAGAIKAGMQAIVYQSDNQTINYLHKLLKAV